MPKPKAAKKTRKRRKNPAPRQLELKDLPQLRRKLWSVMSRKMLDSWVKEDGTTDCFTCGKVIPKGGKVDCGHYLPKKRYKAHWFNADNIRAQCFVCNKLAEGEQVLFDEGLVEELGLNVVLAMWETKEDGWSEDKQWYIDEIRRWIDG
jgi:hypothetical protein